MEVTGGKVALREAVVAAGGWKWLKGIELLGLHSLRSQLRTFTPLFLADFNKAFYLKSTYTTLPHHHHLNPSLSFVYSILEIALEFIPLLSVPADTLLFLASCFLINSPPWFP